MALLKIIECEEKNRPVNDKYADFTMNIENVGRKQYHATSQNDHRFSNGFAKHTRF